MNSRITRRDLLRASSLLAVSSSCLKPLRAGSAPSPAAATQPSSTFAYVGTYTPNGGGIYLFRIDTVTAALTQLQVIDDIRNPTWLALNPAQTHLYAVSEIDNYQGTQNGAVVSYVIDSANMQLKRLGAVKSGGMTPAHLSVHPSGKFVFAANYGGGNVAVFPVGADGALGEATDVRPSVGPRHHVRASSDLPGQFALSDHDGPHLHMVAADPSGQFVIANDAGLDLTLVWRFDAAAGRLLPADVPVITAPPGSAPRHFAFHPSGRVFYNLYEHDAKVAVYDYDAARGGLKLKQVVSSLPAKFEGSNLSAEILITADGRFLYVSNRLHNAIAVFGVAADGELRSVAETWVHADSPRSMSLDPSGAFLYSCNQRGDSITSFHLNPLTGTLTFTGRFEAVGSPAVMTILKRA
ncbi:MAG: 6-phosphogluconolactonase [Gammaproteobacteria bacterium]|nr:6-phosphogluconolactonase [Gammaproteobacteria bacterium]